MHTVEIICRKIEILNGENGENVNNNNTKHLIEAINGLYQTPNFGYIDSIRNILYKLFRKDESSSDLKLLKLLLSVQTFQDN
jgi:hypothetical protein